MRYTFGKQYTCFYCGEPADCIDHTIPYSWFRDTKRTGHRQQESIGFMTYSCKEYNQIPSKLKEYFIDTDYEPVMNKTAVRPILPEIPV